ncbi:L,D-transpeptidase family protein [Streptomyces sp. NPDC046939]|uniref:L,D-transpeptidase family protein n=1 Tax=Streptomyces sp. NPDC046939 TaxID=3155376 RepID=UPI0033E92620
MRTAVIRRTLAGLGVLALACGCKVQTVGAGGPGQSGAAPVGPSASAAASAAPPSPAHVSPSSPRDDKPSTPAAAPPRPPATTAPPPRTLYAPGSRGTQVRELQARLRQIAWLFDGPTGTYDAPTAKAVGGFQLKRGLPSTGITDTVTWQRLVAMTHEPTRDELYAAGGQPAAKPDPRCMTGRALCISKKSRTVSWIVDGKRLLTTDVRFGSQYTPTREGVFHVFWKSRHHVSTIYHTPMPYAMFFSGGQAVHYSSDFAARGYNGASHGCVNVRDKAKIASLFAQVRTGDKVVIYW